MKLFFYRLFLFTLAFYFGPKVLRGMYVESALAAFFMAIAFSFLNQFVKPLLILITIPVTCLTLGFFLLFINALLLLMADYLVDGFDFNGFLPAFVFSLILAMADSILRFFIRENPND